MTVGGRPPGSAGPRSTRASGIADPTFQARWDVLKATFDAAAPEHLRAWFPNLPAVERARIVELVISGKSARGLLTCLVCEALGGRLEQALARAVAIECLQAATLVHDDVIDGDTARRGRPAVWLTIGVRRAVLLGDLMFATMLAQAARRSMADMIVLSETIATIAGGAFAEPAQGEPVAQIAEFPTPGLDWYDDLIHRKTGALFGAAAALGAIAAEASTEVQTAAFAFGSHLGEAYQIADDIADGIPGLDARGETPSVSVAQAISRFLEHRGEPAPARSSALTETRLRRGLEREIDRRLALSRAALDRFPDAPFSGMLQLAPEYIIALQHQAR